METNLFVFFQVNVGEDCPVFDGLFEFCQLSTGGSVGKEYIPFIKGYSGLYQVCLLGHCPSKADL